MTNQDIHPAVESVQFEIESKTSIVLGSKFNFSNKSGLIACLKAHDFYFVEDAGSYSLELMFFRETSDIKSILSVSKTIFDKNDNLISPLEYKSETMLSSLINLPLGCDHLVSRNSEK